MHVQPEDYALLPFVDTTYKNELLDRLKSDVGSFADLTTISTPVIAEPPKVEESSGGLSLPMIIGIVAGGVVGLLLLACGAYALGSRRDVDIPSVMVSVPVVTINQLILVDIIVATKMITCHHRRSKCRLVMMMSSVRWMIQLWLN